MTRNRTALGWTAALALLVALVAWLARGPAQAPAHSEPSAAHRQARTVPREQPSLREGETPSAATATPAGLQRSEVLAAGDSETPERPRGELHIEVLDPHGAPAPHARLWVEDEHASRATVVSFALEHRSDVHELAAGLGLELQLDSSGRAVAPAPRKAVRVGARAPGLAGCTVVAATDTVCTVRLAPSHDLSVRVVSASGEPIEGAFVALTIEDAGAELLRGVSVRKPALVARTDARGLAVLRDVESHASELDSSWRIEPLLVRADPRSHSVERHAPPDAPLEFRVNAFGSLRVEVRDRAGKLVAGEGRVALGERDWVMRSSLRTQSGLAPEERLRGGVALFRCVGLMQDLTVHLDPALALRRRPSPAPPLMRHGESGLAPVALEP